MHVVNRNTVGLNSMEMQAYEAFEGFLDTGDDIHAAVYRVGRVFPSLAPEFFSWLRGDAIPSQAELVRASLLKCPGPIASAQALQRRIMDGPRFYR